MTCIIELAGAFQECGVRTSFCCTGPRLMLWWAVPLAFTLLTNIHPELVLF